MLCELTADRVRPSLPQQHKVVDPPGRTKARLVPMVCETGASKKHKPRVLMAWKPGARSSTRQEPMLVEASGRTKAGPSW